MITEVQITKSALKDLKRTPLYLQEKFRSWLVAVNKVGLRSIRLNKQWRAIYIIKSNGTIEFVEITEVMPHEY